MTGCAPAFTDGKAIITVSISNCSVFVEKIIPRMKFTFYGHACFLVECGGKKLLFDPFITQNELAKDIDITAVEADYILLSHGHFDHIADAVALTKSTGAKVICSWEIYEWLGKQGLTNIHPMNLGGQWAFDFGTVKCVAARHSSGLPDGSYGGPAMGFIVTPPEGAFYYSGDTALTMDMQLIPLWAKLNFAVLPVGDNFTMGIDDAARAAAMIDCNTIIGVHYETFGYIKINHPNAKERFAADGRTLLLPAIGETITL
jgi:L-ascorbate metabolism protein UlaG (beta-lactamase superfamily)